MEDTTTIKQLALIGEIDGLLNAEAIPYWLFGGWGWILR